MSYIQLVLQVIAFCYFAGMILSYRATITMKPTMAPRIPIEWCLLFLLLLVWPLWALPELKAWGKHLRGDPPM